MKHFAVSTRISLVLRRLLFASTLLLVLVALGAAYLLSGVSSADTRIHYTINLSNPAVGLLDVTFTLQPGPQPFVDFYLRDPVQANPGFPGQPPRARIRNLTITRAGKPLPAWQALPGFRDVLRIWNGFSQQPLTVTYQVDPLWWKGENAPRSYLGDSFAYLRGMLILYTPLSLKDILAPDFSTPSVDAGFAQVDVHLPPGWSMVSPWGSKQINTPAAGLRNGYFGFGPFRTSDLQFGQTAFLLGVSEQLPADRQATLNQQIPHLFETMLKETGFAPASHTCYFSVLVLPPDPIHGGASGTGSLVVEDSLSIISHEMFHWWNGATLLTTEDANWLKEGFTTYYAVKSLSKAGLWTQDQLDQELSGYTRKVSTSSQSAPGSLTQASQRLVRQNDSAAYNTVYYGGALLAASLDRQLAAQGKSLDDLWPVLNQLQRPVSTQDFLRALAAEGGEGLSQAAAAVIDGKASLEILDYASVTP